VKTLTLEDIQKLPRPDQVRLAAFAARRVVHLAAEIPEALAALEAAEGYVDRRVSAEECEKAADAAARAASMAARAAWAAWAAWATSAAAWAASLAARAANAAWAAARAAAWAASAASAASAADSSYRAHCAVDYALRTIEGTEAEAKLQAEVWNCYDNLLNFDQYMLEGLGLVAATGK
jgi:hypothetical protein